MASEKALRAFYVIAPSRGSDTDTEFFKSDPVHRGEAPKCSACERYLGMRPWLAPRRAQVVLRGRQPGDFAFVSSSEFLVSETVVSAMKAEGMTGLANLEEVEVASTLGVEPAQLPRYFFGEVHQQGADIDPVRSDIERTTTPKCNQCLSDGVASIRGFAIDETTWSGADIFVPRGLPGVVVVSEAFRRASEARRLSNIRLVPTERYTWMASAA